MTYDDAFLQAILETPDDDTPRLIYADWLDERGDPRGEFIRIQCYLATMSADDVRRSPLEQHERELLARHQDKWLGELRPLLCGWTFRRGFLNAIYVPASSYLKHAPFRLPLTIRRLQVDLDGFEPSQDILELVPESIARENVVLPIGLRGRTLVMAALEPLDAEMLTKVRFILNRKVVLVAADGEQIRQAIDRLYGLTETEPVDCILHLFPDTAMDFETEAADEDAPVAKVFSPRSAARRSILPR